MASDQKEHQLPPPPVVSAHRWKCRPCFRLRRCFSHPRSPRPAMSSSSSDGGNPPCRQTHFVDGRSAAQAYWNRVRRLEQELVQLEKWLDAEEELRGCLSSATQKREAEVIGEEGLVRLDDGCYLCRVKQSSNNWLPRRLVMQLSTPAIAQAGSTASEVLRSMAAMGAEELLACLLDAMPMPDVTSHDVGEGGAKPVLPGSETGFMEAIVLEASEKMEGLALEGLRIQTGPSGGAMGRPAREEAHLREGVVLVVLLQMRDAGRGYQAVGDLMVGLVEACAGRKYQVGGVHVAGIKCCGEGGGGGRRSLWSATCVEGCGGTGESCRWSYVRNPDVAFMC